MYKSKNLLVIFVCTFINTTLAADKGQNIGEQATNPVAPLMSLRVQMQVSTYNNADGESVTGILQIVKPFLLPSKKIPALITRLTAPYMSTHDLGEDLGHAQGMGDTQLLTLLKPNFGLKNQIIALGASTTFPTAGDNEFTGTGQWLFGPAAGYVNSVTKSWQWGGMVWQEWGIATTRSNAEDFSTLSLQPVVTKHFSKGWYVSTPDLPQEYDFEGNHWKLNIGPVVGRVFKIGKQPVQLFAGVYYNTETQNDIPTTEMTYKLNFSWLLPN